MKSNWIVFMLLWWLLKRSNLIESWLLECLYFFTYVVYLRSVFDVSDKCDWIPIPYLSIFTISIVRLDCFSALNKNLRLQVEKPKGIVHKWRHVILENWKRPPPRLSHFSVLKLKHCPRNIFNPLPLRPWHQLWTTP